MAATVLGVLRDDPGLSGEVADHPSTAQALARAHQELRDVDDVAAEAVAGTSALCADVIRVHRETRERLRERHYDQTDLILAAAGMVTEDRAAALGSVVLYLPQDLTHAEAELARALARLTDFHVIAGHTRDPRADAAVLESVRAVVPDAPPHGHGVRDRIRLAHVASMGTGHERALATRLPAVPQVLLGHNGLPAPPCRDLPPEGQAGTPPLRCGPAPDPLWRTLVSPDDRRVAAGRTVSSPVGA